MARVEFALPVVLGTLISLGALAGGPAVAGCVEIWATKLNESHDISSRRTEFRSNDQFVLCVRLEEDSFISIWDVPPDGDVSRLYPNVITHGKLNPTARAEKLSAGTARCFGTPETFPLFFPAEQGIGRGKLSVFATSSIEQQPPLQAYSIPGGKVPRGTMEQVSRSYRSNNRCGDKVEEYVDYNIAR
jgi:hypothetical protein